MKKFIVVALSLVFALSFSALATEGDTVGQPGTPDTVSPAPDDGVDDPSSSLEVPPVEDPSVEVPENVPENDPETSSQVPESDVPDDEITGGELTDDENAENVPEAGNDVLSDILQESGGVFAVDVQSVPDPEYSVYDVRGSSAVDADDASGLKSLIVSIFGEYTPVMSAIAVTEGTGDQVTTTIIDTVADGAAGVDWEWLSGVFLFGILLYCLMRMLGGIVR